MSEMLFDPIMDVVLPEKVKEHAVFVARLGLHSHANHGVCVRCGGRPRGVAVGDPIVETSVRYPNLDPRVYWLRVIIPCECPACHKPEKFVGMQPRAKSDHRVLPVYMDGDGKQQIDLSSLDATTERTGG